MDKSGHFRTSRLDFAFLGLAQVLVNKEAIPFSFIGGFAPHNSYVPMTHSTAPKEIAENCRRI
jgi:hypothetical protein